MLGFEKNLDCEEGLVAKAANGDRGIADRGEERLGKARNGKELRGGPRVKGVELRLDIMCILECVGDGREEYIMVKNLEISKGHVAQTHGGNKRGDVITHHLVLFLDVAGWVFPVAESFVGDVKGGQMKLDVARVGEEVEGVGIRD